MKSTNTDNKVNHSDWTFLSNHAHVFLLLVRNQDIRVRDLAQKINITERAVLKIIKDLESEGYIHIKKHGRRNHYRVNDKKHFKHPLESHNQLSVLISLLTSEGNEI